MPRIRLAGALSSLLPGRDNQLPYKDVQGSELARLKSEVANLKGAVSELKLLLELTQEIGSAFSCDRILDTLVRRCLQGVPAEQAVITLVDRRSGDLDRTLVRAVDQTGRREHWHLQAALLGWMQIHKEPLLSNEPATDPRLRGLDLAANDLRSLVCLPLLHHGELVGILSVCNRAAPEGFSAAEQRLLAIIAGQSAQIVEDSRLHEEATALARMNEQIRLAREIQVALLPHVPPEIPGYEIAGLSRPAEVMGGDYYDYFRIDEQAWSLCLGDIAGKGLPASLLMANLQGTLRGQIIAERELSRSVRQASRLLFRRTATGRFATVLCCILDTRSHTLTYCNAGHERPFLLHEGRCVGRLGTGGVMLGAFEDFAFREETVSLAPGDQLVAFSDGITDAESPTGEPFGDRRLHDLLAGCRGLPARRILEKVLQEVDDHLAGTPPGDDITMFVVKRQP